MLIGKISLNLETLGNTYKDLHCRILLSAVKLFVVIVQSQFFYSPIFQLSAHFQASLFSLNKSNIALFPLTFPTFRL